MDRPADAWLAPSAATQPLDDGSSDPVESLDSADDARLVDAVLDQLVEAGHLSEARFTESRIHARQARFGNRRIAAELREHGLAVPDDQRQALRDSELARARQVLAARFGDTATVVKTMADGAGARATADEGQRWRERARLQRFLLARGFSPETVRAALSSAIGAALDEPDAPEPAPDDTDLSPSG